MFARRFAGPAMAWLCCFCGSVLLCLSMMAQAAETMTVISDDNYPPYLFKDANGNTVGIVADTWKFQQALAKETFIVLGILDRGDDDIVIFAGGEIGVGHFRQLCQMAGKGLDLFVIVLIEIDLDDHR